MSDTRSSPVMQRSINWTGLVLVFYMLSALVFRPLGGELLAPLMGVGLAVYGLLYCAFGKELSLAIWVVLASILTFIALVWVDVLFQHISEVRLAAALFYQSFILLLAACLGRFIGYAAVNGVVLAALSVLAAGLIFSADLSEFRYSTIYGEAINQMGALMAIGFGLSIWLCDYHVRRARLWTAGVVFVCGIFLLVGALLSGSRQSIALALSWIIMVLALGRVFWVAIIAGIVSVIVYIWIRIVEVELYIFQRVQGLLAMFGLAEPTGERSIGKRVSLLNEAVEGWREAPFMGKGVRAFEKYSGHEMYAHNNYLELLYNHGLIGFSAFYLPLLIALGSAIIALRRKSIGREGAALVMGCCLFLLVQGLFIVNYHHYLTWCILIIIISVWSNSWVISNGRDKYIS